MTPKEAAAMLGKPATFRGHEYTIKAIIKRLTDKGVIWQIELSKGNGVVIADPREVESDERT
jgi:hypothetical protein